MSEHAAPPNTPASVPEGSSGVASLVARLEPLLAAGRDDDAHALLRAARAGGGGSAVALGAAWMAATLDDERAAQGYLERLDARADDEASRAVRALVELRAALRTGQTGASLADAAAVAARRRDGAPHELRGLLVLEIAAARTAGGDGAGAQRLLVDEGTGGGAALGLPSRACEVAFAHWRAARDGDGALLRAIADLEAAGALRSAGRALLRYAQARSHEEPAGDLAPLFGRAATILRAIATWRDRLHLREGFSRQGRRTFDRIVSAEQRERLRRVEITRGSLANAAARDRTERMLAVPPGARTQDLADEAAATLREAVEAHDRACSELVADHEALIAEVDLSRSRERQASLRLATALDTLRQAVFVCDADGVVVASNAAAAALAQERGKGRERARPLEGVRVTDLPGMGALAEIVRTGDRVDGVVVRLGAATMVATGRPTEEENGKRGYVLSLLELEQATRLAQRLSVGRTRYTFSDILGSSPALAEAIELARRAAAGDASVLITGESGTGKEVFAQAIHAASPRGHHPFVGINCAAMPRDLLEAELFGYEDGAFTGARAGGKQGKLVAAGHGTMLLDEIGDMPLDMQAKLLRVLQERVVCPVGGTAETPIHARILATTHRDLGKQIEAGTFRLDLFYRLRVIALELPSLRARREDVPLLALHYLRFYAAQQRKAAREIRKDLLERLAAHTWSGNVRELANLVEAEVSLMRPEEEVLETLRSNATLVRRPPPREGPRRASSPIIPIAELERQAYEHALVASKGNVTRAAQSLGVSKNTLYAKLRGWGLHKGRED